ncbi:unnamed protein product [Urochloa humidicola]
MAAPSASEVKKVEDDDRPWDMSRAFRWVMESSSSSSPTIGEHNKNTNACRACAWLILVFLPSMFIATSLASPYINREPAVFPLPVMLWCVYMAVVEMTMWHSTLFLPDRRRPSPRWKLSNMSPWRRLAFLPP